MLFLTSREAYADISNFRSAVSDIKAEIFRKKTLDMGSTDEILKRFPHILNPILKKWEEYADDLTKTFRNIDPRKVSSLKVTTLTGDYMNSIVFAKHDYASVAAFTDGLMRGIADKTIRNPGDVETFFRSTVELAYNFDSKSVGDLLETYLGDPELNADEMDASDTAMFTVFRNQHGMFMTIDRENLYRATIKSLEAFLEWMPEGTVALGDVRIVVSVLNNFFEYIIYSVSAFIVRRYLVGAYLMPIYRAINPQESHGITPVAPFEEGVIPGIAGMDREVTCGYAPLRDFNEMDLRDPEKLTELLDMSEGFVQWMGGVIKSWKETTYDLKKNPIVKEYSLMTNPLVKHLVDSRFIVANARTIVIDHGLIKALMINPNQALSGITTPKDDLLHIIRGVDYGTGTKNATSLAIDLTMMMKEILIGIKERIYQLAESYEGEFTISTEKMASELNLMYHQIYGELAHAFYRKLRYLELIYIRDMTKKVDVLDQMLTVGDILNGTMTLAVPPTTRMDISMMDQFQIPVFESLQMCDAYLSLLPEFANDAYFSEAVSDIVNALISFIQGLFNSLASMFNRFKPAAEWVSRNKEVLDSLTVFTSAKGIEVLKYRIPSNIDQYVRGLKIESVKSNINKPIDEFKESLYDNPKVYDWFKNDTNGTATIKLTNMVIFGEQTPSEKKPAPVKLNTDAAIREALTEWTNDIINSDRVKEILDSYHKEFKAVSDYIKQESLRRTADEERRNQTQQQAQGAQNQGQQQNQNKEEPEKKDIVSFNEYVTAYTRALGNVWRPIQEGILAALRDEYNYLKQAYAIGKKDSNKNAGEGSEEENSADKT